MGKDSISKNGTRLTALLLAVLISTQHAKAEEKAGAHCRVHHRYPCHQGAV